MLYNVFLMYFEIQLWNHQTNEYMKLEVKRTSTFVNHVFEDSTVLNHISELF